MSIARRRFRIIKEIAEGGFGKVYLAEQISSDGFSRIVAVKLLHAKWSNHDEIVMRTRDEARLLGLIRHQHIVKVEDLTAIDGKAAIVMEYLEGIDLKWLIQFLQERSLVFPRKALFEIIVAVASALDAAYNGTPLQGGEPLKVIHRDIKPSNIFVTVAGGVKVLDFGTARANFAEREAKTQALAFGSQGYMAPERMLGEQDTAAADIFSLGITLYELLSLEGFGRIPPRPNKFARKIDDRVASLELEGDAEWGEQVRDTLSLMLSYAPAERPTAAQLVEIMEILAQDAKDTGLRRMCRTHVAEAKAALPEFETGDPLTGQIVDEDISAVHRKPKAAGDEGRSLAPAGALSSPSPETMDFPSSTKDSHALERPSAPAAVPGRKGRAVGLLAAGGVLAAVAAAGGALLLVALVVWWVTQEKAPVPQPEPVLVDEATGGGRVVTPDSRSDVPHVPTVLTFGDPAGGSIDIIGPGDFRAEWDGLAPFDLGPLGAGTYKSNVSGSDGTKWRLKSFKVKPDTAGCEYQFDLDAGGWTGGCR